MKLSQFKKHLDNLTDLNFVKPNGNFIPKHFHITEAGVTTKKFIDCGGNMRLEKFLNFQIWTSSDFQHRLEPLKLKKIIELAESLFENEDLDIEIEYQTETIGRYGLDFDQNKFLLTTKNTNCLAHEHCGITVEKPKVKLSDLQLTQTSYCSGDSDCC